MSKVLDKVAGEVGQSRFIYVTGADGTGKSTLSALMLSQLEAEGYHVTRVWLRFAQLTSIPFLIYARWRGFSFYEQNEDVRYGYWDFRKSWVMRNVFPWFVWFDALLFALFRLYLPYLSGQTIICERFVLDMIVDLAVASDDFTFWKRYPGKLFLQLIPPKASIAILDLDADTIRQRRPALQWDGYLEQRLRLYRQLAQDYDFTIINTQQSVDSIATTILKESKGR